MQGFLVPESPLRGLTLCGKYVYSNRHVKEQRYIGDILVAVAVRPEKNSEFYVIGD